MAQIFDPLKSESTVGFVSVLCSKLGEECEIKVASTPNDISKDKPVLVMCPNYSRIAADIKHATQDIGVSGIPDHLVAVVIIHAKAKHSLPTQKTSDVVEDEHCTKYKLLVDFGYLDGHLHACKMNTQGEIELRRFLSNNIVEGKSQELVVGTETKPKRDATAQQGGRLKGAIQFYSDRVFDDIIQHQLNIPGEFQVVRSVVDLRKENMWIVVCNAGSVDEYYVRKGFCQNAKILVLIDDQAHHVGFKKDGTNMLEIKLNYDSVGRKLLLQRQNVTEFIHTFIDNDVPEKFFVESNTRIEAYTDVRMTKDDFYKNLGIKPRVVQSVTDLTKLDPRILWVIVYKGDSSLVKDFVEASLANATVILRLDESVPKKEIQFEDIDNEFLLIGSLCRSSLPLNDHWKHQMKEEITKLMRSVQNILLKEPLEKFLES